MGRGSKQSVHIGSPLYMRTGPGMRTRSYMHYPSITQPESEWWFLTIVLVYRALDETADHLSIVSLCMLILFYPIACIWPGSEAGRTCLVTGVRNLLSVSIWWRWRCPRAAAPAVESSPVTRTSRPRVHACHRGLFERPRRSRKDT